MMACYVDPYQKQGKPTQIYSGCAVFVFMVSCPDDIMYLWFHVFLFKYIFFIIYTYKSHKYCSHKDLHTYKTVFLKTPKS